MTPEPPMFQGQRVSRWKGITAKQAAVTLIIAIAMSLLAGVAELSLEASQMRDEIQEQTRQRLDLVDGTAAEAAFQLNPDLAQQVANGLFDAGNVKRIELRDDFGRRMAVRELERDTRGSWLARRLFGDIVHYEQRLDYHVDGEENADPVGEIELTLALDSLGKAFVERSVLIFSLGVIKAFAIAALVVLAFHFLITRPLLKVHAAIAQVDPERPGEWPKPRLRYHGNDELGHLVAGLDRLLKAFQHGLDQRDRLHQISTVDGLTGIANRRRFDTFLSDEWQRARRSGYSLSVLFIDIDFFKPFNDNYGHTVGDDSLRQVAHSISSTVSRTSDLAARFGGEEFVCVLPGTDIDGASAVAKRIRGAIEALNIPHAFSPVHDRITVSIGVASATPDQNDASPAPLVKQADQRLYQAKTQGRNRVVAQPD